MENIKDSYADVLAEEVCLERKVKTEVDSTVKSVIYQINEYQCL